MSVGKVCWAVDRMDMALRKEKMLEGHLAGLASRARDSWPQGCEFKLHIGPGAYLKKSKKERRQTPFFLKKKKGGKDVRAREIIRNFLRIDDN